MTIPGVYIRFLAWYLGLAVVVGLVIGFLGLEGIRGVNIGILIGTTLLVCNAFAKKNGRYFEKNEKTQVVTGLIVIDLAVQSLVGWLSFAQQPEPVGIVAFLTAVALVAALHAVVIYCFVEIAAKPLRKRGLIPG